MFVQTYPSYCLVHRLLDLRFRISQQLIIKVQTNYEDTKKNYKCQSTFFIKKLICLNHSKNKTVSAIWLFVI